MILLFTLLFLKHFVFDFLYQPPYQWMNKGTYGHLGGILHALQHAVGTAVVLVFAAPQTMLDYPHLLLQVPLAEAALHYHIDWAKMNLNKKMGWGANTHSQFWMLLGLDQLLHSLTYVGIVGVICG